MLDLETAIARFGANAKAKLSNPSATGEPEDQLRAPLEALFEDLAELCGFKREWVAAVGESSLSNLKTRPDYAVTLRNVLVGFVEVKALGKGADPPYEPNIVEPAARNYPRIATELELSKLR